MSNTEVPRPYAEEDDSSKVAAETDHKTTKDDEGALAAEHEEDPRLRDAGKQSYHCYGIFEDN